MSYYEVLPSEDNFFETFENKEMVASALKKLNDTEKEIIRCRFDEELSQTETARRMGVSQMFVSRMERKILDKLKTDLKKSMAD